MATSQPHRSAQGLPPASANDPAGRDAVLRREAILDLDILGFGLVMPPSLLARADEVIE